MLLASHDLPRPSHTGFRIRTWAVLMALVILTPLLLLSSLAAVDTHLESTERVRAELARRTEGTAKDLGMQLDIAAHALEALAVTEAAVTEDFQALYTSAQRVKARVPGAVAIGLIDRDFQLRFVTSRPFGDRPGQSPSTVAAKQAFATGRSAVSDLFYGPFVRKWVVSIAVPVFVGGSAKYCLIWLMTADTVSQILTQEFPPDWIASIVDRRQTIVARSRDPEKFVGSQASDEFRAFIAGGGDGALQLRTKEGLWASGYTARIPGYDWRLGVAVPDSMIQAPLRRALGIALAQFLIGVAIAVSIAFTVGQNLERWLSRALRSMRQIADGEPTELERSGVTELDEVARKFAQESMENRAARTELQASERQNQTLLRHFEDAKLDLLTGVLRRRFVIEAIHALKADADARHGMRVGLVFIDLDRFKDLNDRLGHGAGDEALQQVGVILQMLLGPDRTAGRWGGDEFVIALAASETALPQALTEIEQALKSGLAAGAFHLGCSVGAAIWDETCGSIDELVHRADARMYGNKRRMRARKP